MGCGVRGSKPTLANDSAGCAASRHRLRPSRPAASVVGDDLAALVVFLTSGSGCGPRCRSWIPLHELVTNLSPPLQAKGLGALGEP
jgi:hypothetical protein